MELSHIDYAVPRSKMAEKRRTSFMDVPLDGLLVFEDFAWGVDSFRVFPGRKCSERNSLAADHTGYLTKNC